DQICGARKCTRPGFQLSKTFQAAAAPVEFRALDMACRVKALEANEHYGRRRLGVGKLPGEVSGLNRLCRRPGINRILSVTGTEKKKPSEERKRSDESCEE